MHRVLALPILLAAAPTPGPLPIAPGYWLVTSRATHADLPHVPPELAGALLRKTEARRCITPDLAVRSPVAAIGDPRGCTTTYYRLVGGVLNMTVTCPGPYGGSRTVRLLGSFLGNSYSSTGSIVETGGMRGDMRIDFTESGRRSGDCPIGAQD